MKTTASATNLPGPGWLLLLLVLALLIRLPAHLGGTLVATVCPSQCRLADTSGTLWAGSGQLFLHNGENWFNLGQLAWQVLPGKGYARLSLGSGTIDWSELKRIDIAGIVLPAASILAQPAFGLPGGPWQGALEFSASQFQLTPDNQPKLAGSGQIVWRNAASALLADHPLGDYRIDWQWNGSTRPTANFSGGRSTAIRVEGKVSANGLHAQILLKDDARTALTRYVKLIAQADAGAEGSHVIVLPWD